MGFSDDSRSIKLSVSHLVLRIKFYFQNYFHLLSHNTNRMLCFNDCFPSGSLDMLAQNSQLVVDWQVPDVTFFFLPLLFSFSDLEIFIRKIIQSLSALLEHSVVILWDHKLWFVIFESIIFCRNLLELNVSLSLHLKNK